MALELFHLLADPDCAKVRRRIGELELFDRVELRNISFESHRTAFESHGGTRVPAIWEGTRLHQGLEATLAVIEGLVR